MTGPPAGPIAPMAAVAGLAVAVVAWVVLSVATGLIFHFMPAAPVVASMVMYRWATGGDRLGWLAIGLLCVTGLAAAVAGVLAVEVAGGALDEPPLVVGAALIGTAIAIWLGRRVGQPVTAR